jgi:hypothetical protein
MAERSPAFVNLFMSAIFAGKNIESMTRKLKSATTVATTHFQRLPTASMTRAIWFCIESKGGSPTKRFLKLKKESFRSNNETKSISMQEGPKRLQYLITDIFC